MFKTKYKLMSSYDITGYFLMYTVGMYLMITFKTKNHLFNQNSQTQKYSIY